MALTHTKENISSVTKDHTLALSHIATSPSAAKQIGSATRKPNILSILAGYALVLIDKQSPHVA